MTGVAALVLIVAALGPTVVATLWGDAFDRLVALEAQAVAATVVLLLLAQAFDRPAYLDVGLMLAVLSFAGSLVFARFLGRSL